MFTLTTPWKMSSGNYWCAAEGCNSADRKRGKYAFMKDILFFPFPSKLKASKLRKRWLELMRREDYDPNRRHRLCSRHFADGKPTNAHPYPELFSYNNYKQSIRPRSVKLLEKLHQQKEDASSKPTLKVKDIGTDNELPMSMMLADIPDCDQVCSNSATHQAFIPVIYEEVVETSQRPEKDDVMTDHCYQTDHRNKPVCFETGVQTDITMNDIFKYEEKLKSYENDQAEHLRDAFVQKIIKSDASVRRYTGLPTKDNLNGLFGILDKASPMLNYWSGQGSSVTTPYQEEPGRKKSGPARKLTRYQEFLLTLVRLRLALLTFVVADVFSVSNARVSQIFTTWINYMHAIFSPLLKWPSSDRNKKHMPRSFKETFPKTTCIIDCTEFFIEKPKSPTAQSQTYSSYKHRNTYKALVGISPSGAFTFVSDLWGGNTSDRYITIQSGFLDNIKPGDEVMADRGFLIRDVLLERHATLNIPPFTKKCSWGKGKRLNASDIDKTKSIARLRIHVERAIERLKNFHMLSDTMPLKLKPLANQMLKVCTFFCNFQEPLVKK